MLVSPLLAFYSLAKAVVHQNSINLHEKDVFLTSRVSDLLVTGTIILPVNQMNTPDKTLDYSGISSCV